MTIPGVLLTGGASRRMGTDKALLVVNGATLAARAGRVLAAVCSEAIEVGPGVSGLRSVQEDPAGAGPLAAFCAGVDALGASGAVLLLACDLPLVDEDALRTIAAWAGEGSAVPVVAGRPQYACARWSAAAIAHARASGERALKALAVVDAALIVDPPFGAALADVDTPEDLDRLGLS
jgi:molybdopterin-guanine dinucleotide biosynthesis protein A